MVGTYTVRIIGPGMDFYETVEADGLAELKNLVVLVIQKFEREAERAARAEEASREIGNGSLATMPKTFWEVV